MRMTYNPKCWHCTHPVAWRLSFAAVCIAWLVFALTAAAPAGATGATGHGAMIARNHQSHRACTDHCVNFQLNGGASPEWTQSEWSQNVTPKWYLRGHGRCVIHLTNIAATVNGGWVTSVGLWSRATCPDSRYTMIHAGWQYKKTANGTIYTTWAYPTTPAGRRLARER